MKNKVVLFCCICLGVLLVGCGAKTTPEIIMPEEPVSSSVSEENDNKAEDSDKKKDSSATKDDSDAMVNYKVYLITMDLTDAYWQSIDKGCQNAVKELGNITYKWIGPDSHDDQLQSKCIDDAVADGANAILISANSAEGVNDSLKKAEEAGCKIVYVDSAATYDCVAALATDNVKAGKTAGETMIKRLESKGIDSGTIGVMGVTKETFSCIAREKGFREAFKGTKYKLADTVYMNDDADKVAAAVKDGLNKDYVGFFGSNEGTTVAIGNEIKEEGKESNVVGFDTSDDVLSFVSENVIYATMQQNPEVMGHDGLEIAVKALKGEYTETNTKKDTGVTVITKESM